MGSRHSPVEAEHGGAGACPRQNGGVIEAPCQRKANGTRHAKFINRSPRAARTICNKLQPLGASRMALPCHAALNQTAQRAAERMREKDLEEMGTFAS